MCIRDSEIGVQAILALHDAVLFITEGGRPEPAGAVLLVEMAVPPEQVDATRDQSGIEKRFFREPDIEFDAELLQIVATVGQLLGQGMLMHVGPVRALSLIHI